MKDDDYCPKTLLEAARYFADRDVCEAYMRKIKWPDGKITCHNCGAHGDRIGEIKTRHMLRCKDCRKQFSHKVGTIFEDSPLGLDKWFVTVWSIANCKNGISSHELGRAIGVTQKTAWFMLHRIRKAMDIADSGEFGGPAEADTTYVGGEAKNMHKHKREKKIKGRGQSPLAGARVFTDAASVYSELCFTHLHKSVDHSTTWVVGDIHTNGLENFWSLLKRALRGTYVAVAPYHLHRYVAEQEFRFNERIVNDADRFLTVLGNIVGKRLTYRVLAGIDSAGFMGIE